ncbi:transport and Golgi organization protein 1 homolog isoform X4 [Lutra lutra]|uniref:transport and Golgi organization protein 1 homolog isoform X4 n=1 Tax=Lutra lutra TaxID=9657 RepID=UPI001FD57358|nr:transport and Golgi organization protein 1 homolog isoform X4 [Lutra lutra]
MLPQHALLLSVISCLWEKIEISLMAKVNGVRFCNGLLCCSAMALRREFGKEGESAQKMEQRPGLEGANKKDGQSSREDLSLGWHVVGYQLVLSLPDHFHLGPDGIEVLWKLLILTASLGTCAFLIYLWRTVLAIKPRQYEVTLEQIKMKINDLKKENSVLEENIASCEEKVREAKKQGETKRKHKLSLAQVHKLKENIKKVEEINENLKDSLHCNQALLQAEREKNIKNVDMAQDELGDQELRAFTSKNQELKERKKFLEDQRNSLSSQKTAKEAELNLLKKKVDMVVEFSEKRKLTAEEQEVEEMEDQLLEAELTFNHKIAVQERNAVANWMKARYWETRMMQQSRENAYLKYRLRMMEGETLPVGSMWRGPMPRRPELQEPVWQGREHDGKRSS